MKYVIGYASLLSEISIRRLFSNVGRIRPVEISGHARCFNSYGTLSINKGLASIADRNLAHASAILRPFTKIRALAFEIGETDFEIYEKHEFRYSLREVNARCLETGESFKAIMCYENTDHLIDTSLVGSDDIFGLYKQYDTHSFWHTDHLPADVYLNHCIASAFLLGDDVVDNFLDTSFIHDRETSIRKYLEASGFDIKAYVSSARLSKIL